MRNSELNGQLKENNKGINTAIRSAQQKVAHINVWLCLRAVSRIISTSSELQLQPQQ